MRISNHIALAFVVAAFTRSSLNVVHVNGQLTRCGATNHRKQHRRQERAAQWAGSHLKLAPSDSQHASPIVAH